MEDGGRTACAGLRPKRIAGRNIQPEQRAVFRRIAAALQKPQHHLAARRTRRLGKALRRAGRLLGAAKHLARGKQPCPAPNGGRLRRVGPRLLQPELLNGRAVLLQFRLRAAGRTTQSALRHQGRPPRAAAAHRMVFFFSFLFFFAHCSPPYRIAAVLCFSRKGIPRRLFFT